MTAEQIKVEQTTEEQLIVEPTTREPPSVEPPEKKVLPGTRIHGFYAKVLTEEEQALYDEAVKIQGMDTEIALMRVKILSIIARDPDNIKLLTHATNALARLVMTKYNISKNDKPGIMEGVLNVFRDVAEPIGILRQFFTK